MIYLKSKLPGEILPYWIVMTQQEQLPADSGANRRSSLTFLASVAWWRKALQAAFAFAPHCLLPSLSLSLSNVVMLVGLHVAYGAINQSQINFDDLLRAAMVGVSSAAVGLGLTCWAVGLWLFRLTAFSRTQMTGSVLARELFLESIVQIRGRSGYLAKLWLVASAFLLVPVVPLCIAVSVQILSSPDYIGARVLSIALPDWAPAVATFFLVLLTGVATAYSLVTLVVSSVSTLPAKDAAIEALKLSARHWISVLVITIVMLLVNCLITTPQALLAVPTFVEVKRTPLFIDIALQLWMALTSAVLWPLSLTPFCELLRDEVK